MVQVLEKNSKVLNIYGRGAHLGHVTRTIYIRFYSTYQGGSTRSLALIVQAVSVEVFEHLNSVVNNCDDGHRSMGL